MSDLDFETWKSKKDSLEKEAQRINIYNKAKFLIGKGKLPKSFSSKINKLKRIIS
jgi:hypothetical protein